MCTFRVYTLKYVVVIMLIKGACLADDTVQINKREDIAESKTFGQMFNEFISNLFGPDSDPKELASKQINESSQNALKAFLTNMTQSLTAAPAADNSTAVKSSPEQVPQNPPDMRQDIPQTFSDYEYDYTTLTPPLSESAVAQSTSTRPFSASFTETWDKGTTLETWSESTLESDSLPEDDRCYSDAVMQNLCPVPNDMIDVSFWDLYSVLFSDTVLDALIMGCARGSWCLKDRFDYWDALISERVDMVMNSEIASTMCQADVQSCIGITVQTFNNCLIQEQMEFTAEALKLVCDLKDNAVLTASCYKHVITALHVTLADVMREEEQQMETTSQDTCHSPEAQMTKGLICVANSCPGEADSFQSFSPWSWFTSVVDDLITTCDLDTSKCLALLQPPAGYLYGNEYATLIGVSVATMVTVVMFTIAICTCYRRHRRNTVIKEGYQRLLNDGDES